MMYLKQILLVFTIALLLTIPVAAKSLPAVIINSDAKAPLNIYYTDIFLNYNLIAISPRASGKVLFEDNSSTPTTVFITTKKYIGLCVAVMPGDTVFVKYNKQIDTYNFTGNHKSELNLYKQFGESSFSLRSFTPPALYSKSKGFKIFLEEWHNAWMESEEYIQKLQMSPTIRTAIKKHFTLEARLHLFQVLLSPIDSQQPTEPLQPLPDSYKDTVTVYAKKLLIPAYNHDSPQIAYMLRTYAMFTAAVEGYYSSHSVQYTFSKRDYKGYQRELACYSALKDMFMFNTAPNILPSLVEDYQKWVSSDSKLLKKILKIKGLDDRKLLSDKSLNDPLITANGKQLGLLDIIAQHRGRVIYLDLWASWCGPCLAEMPASIEMRKSYESEELVFVYLSTDDDNSKWLKSSNKFLAGSNKSYRFKDSKSLGLVKIFKIESIPHYMLIDKKGVLRYSGAPRPSDPSLKKILDSLLQL